MKSGNQHTENQHTELQHTKLLRNIRLDYIYTFLRNLDMSSSIWVLYLAFRGMTLGQVGILEGIYHVTSMLFEIPSGAAADLLGRKRTILAGRACGALCCIIMLFSRSFSGFALGFIIQALGNNLNSGSEEALLYDSMKAIGREKDYLGVNCRINLCIEISQAIATVAGGILAEYSYVWCYGACAVIAVAGLLPVLAMTEPPMEECMEEDSEEDLSVRNASAGRHSASDGNLFIRHFRLSFQILRENKLIRNIVLYYSALFTMNSLLYFYSQQYFYDLGWNKIQISIVMLFAGAAGCLGAVCSEKLYEKTGKGIVLVAAVVIALSMTVYGLRNPFAAVSALLASSFFNSVLYPVQSISLNRLLPSAQRATLISVNSMAFSVGMALLFPAVGALADISGLETVIAGLGLLGFVGVMAAKRLDI